MATFVMLIMYRRLKLLSFKMSAESAILNFATRGVWAEECAEDTTYAYLSSLGSTFEIKFKY
jgi:hypothetical protein